MVHTVVFISLLYNSHCIIVAGNQKYSLMSLSLVRQGGAEAIAVFVNQSDEYYEQLIPRLNGIYFPGGSSNKISSPYAETAKKIYKYGLITFSNLNHCYDVVASYT